MVRSVFTMHYEAFSVVVGGIKKIPPLHKNNAVNLDTNKQNKVQRFVSFLVVWLLIFNGEIFAQIKPWDYHYGPPDQNKIIRENIKRINAGQHTISQIKVDNYAFVVWKHEDITRPGCFGGTQLVGVIIKPTTYTKDEIGWFCKKELQLDKLTLLPIRFRLGSLNYVNWMEQKPNTIKPGL
jgi:hypothetical protein